MSHPEQYTSSNPPPPPPPPPGLPPTTNTSTRSSSRTRTRASSTPPSSSSSNTMTPPSATSVASTSSFNRTRRSLRRKESEDLYKEEEEDASYSASVFDDPFGNNASNVVRSVTPSRSPPPTVPRRERSTSSSNSSRPIHKRSSSFSGGAGGVSSPTTASSSSSSLLPPKPFKSRTSTSSTTTNSFSSSPRHAAAATKNSNQSTTKSKFLEREIQNPLDDLYVKIKTVELANRTAFERILPPSGDELRDLAGGLGGLEGKKGGGVNFAEDHQSVVSEATSIGGGFKNKRWKISPSPQHSSVLHRIYNTTSARQLNWGASVSPEADPFTSWLNDDDDDENEENISDNEDKSKAQSIITKAKRRKNLAKKKRSKQRNGRYTPINPYTTTLSNDLPNTTSYHIPLFTNKKRRLPTRADVGFPRPQEEDVENKQREIQCEAELEESRPRIVCIVGAVDVGVVEKQGGSSGGGVVAMNDALHEDVRCIAKEWSGGRNGGGWENANKNKEVVGWSDIPLAGKNLVMARYNDARFASTLLSTTTKKKKKAPKPSPTSTFSPPIDASFSSTLGWRPRPFADRPSGCKYFVAAPIDLVFDKVGDLEPLVCSMALYVLKQQGEDGGIKGKISEEFVFPAGDWGGMIQEESAKILAAHFAGKDYMTSIDGGGGDRDRESSNGGEQQMWRKRKRRGLFSYDPLALGDEKGCERLFLVVQVHKATHVDAAGAYLAHGEMESGERRTKGNAASVGTVQSTPAKKKKLTNRIKRFGKSIKKHGASSIGEKETIESSVGGGSSGGYTEGTSGNIPPPFTSSKTIHSPTVIPTGGGATHSEDTAARTKSMKAFNAFGTQFLTPVAFGLCPVFPPGTNNEGSPSDDDAMQWPHGAMHQMQLYAYPSTPESHEDFVDRLTKLADAGLDASLDASSEGGSIIQAMSTDDMSGGKEEEASLSASASFPPPHPEKIASSSRNIFKKFGGKQHGSSMDENQNRLIAGKAYIFTSVLGVDFTQAMLQTPAELSFPSGEEEEVGNSGGGTPMSSLPRLLVDVSGDCAIMMNPDVGSSGAGSSAAGSSGASVASSGGAKKRSNLVRLPAASDPSGYADSFEVKEVLYLPPRLDRKYDHDIPICSRTMLNLLYLYPRLIKPDEKEGDGFEKNRFYSVRIRLVRQGINIDEETGAMETAYDVLDAIYNPAPAGPPILKTMYTKIPHSISEETKSGKHADGVGGIGETGIPLRDEVKVRLPDILDGGHFLQFSLVSVELKDGFSEADNDANSHGLVPEPLAETLIPLSSSSTRETTSGTKITTIIPNGLHRIKIGQFQLQVETRLASSVHVSDPAVAMTLRDFPYASGEDGLSTVLENQLAIPHSRSAVGSDGMAASKSATPTNVPFYRIISNASEQSVVHHFHALVFMHMCNFVNRGAPEFDLKSTSQFFLGSKNHGQDALPSLSKEFLFLMDNTRSLFELLRKAKTKFLTDSAGVISGKLLLDKFLKDFLDSFDESSLSMRLRETRRSRGVSGDFSTTSIDRHMDASLASRSLDSSANRSQVQQFESLFEKVNDAIEDKMIEAAVRLAVQQEAQTNSFSSARLGDQPLYGRNSTGMTPRGNGNNGLITRRAYGATKTDQMRAEAEMHEHRMHFTFFDDDETVMTEDLRDSKYEKPPPMETVLETIGDNGADNGLMNQWGITEDDSNFDDLTQASAFDSFQSNSQEFLGKSPTADSNAAPLSMGERAKSMARSFSDNNLAKRVNTVAQVFIAPCVAPTLTSTLLTGTANSPGKPKTNQFDGYMIGGAGFTNDNTYPTTYSKVTITQCKDDANTSHGKKPAIISPGSDVEDEEDLGLHADSLNSDLWTYPGAPANARLRSVYRDALNDQLIFSIPIVGDGGHVSGIDASERDQPFTYECIFVLWLQAWIEHAALVRQGEKQNKKSEFLDVSSVVFQSYEPTQPQSIAGSFTMHLDVILPICLKSLVLRCSAGTSEKGKLPTTILDRRHMDILELIVYLMAGGLMCQALSADNDRKESDAALLVALSSSDAVLDFLIGLLAIIHPAQVSLLINKYFDTLRTCEARNGAQVSDENGDSQKGNSVVADSANDSSSESVWSYESLQRVRCARQLRLHAAEKLSTIPRFVALNYPYKFSSESQRRGCQNPSWTNQDLGSKHMKSIGNTENVRHIGDVERFPKSYWLAELLVNECLTICSQSCEAVVAEAVAQIKASSQKRPPLRNRRGNALSRDDLLRFQSTAIHAITCVYELILRRHAMDTRFQSNDCRSRVAAMFVHPVLEKSVSAVHWLSRMESTHKVRSLWLLCFIHILQEAPEVLLREEMRSFCFPPKYRIHRIIRLLRLSTSTFQCFFVVNQDQDQSSTILQKFSPWLIQEIFNTICAATNMLVDECAPIMSATPHEERVMAHGILDLLLHVIATPQSSVTHLRALGGASQALDKFGVALFLEAVGDTLEHWARMVLTLMNSISLSVRSMAVDFIVSLLGGAFEEAGNMDEIALVFLTVLPEVVAREIALFSVSGKISNMKDVECSLWPLRRALADVEETNPLDDDRVDPQLSPFLGTFCRTCQAVIDSVLIELRLKGNQCVIVGSHLQVSRESESGKSSVFDADEESVFEAANFFLPETAPSQRLRWLLTLKSLHESKGQWVEAAETLILCAKTIADAIPYTKTVWRPSRFALWRNNRRSLWLSTIGEEAGIPSRGNTQVMDFADSFLEPPDLLGAMQSGSNGKLEQPTVAIMCKMLTQVAKEAVLKYMNEDGMVALAYQRIEHLLKGVMGVIEDHSSALDDGRRGHPSSHTHLVEENAALRKMVASLNGDLTRLAERLLLLAEEKGDQEGWGVAKSQEFRQFGDNNPTDRQYYVKVVLLGKKPERFIESTTIPTFLEWESSSICRVPKQYVERAFAASDDAPLSNVPSAEGKLEQNVCVAFAKPLLDALSNEIKSESIVLSTEPPTNEILSIEGDTKTFLVVSLVHMEPLDVMNKRIGAIGPDTSRPVESKRFFVAKKGTPGSRATSLIEFTVAQQFPCALSRQRTLITSEFYSES